MSNHSDPSRLYERVKSQVPEILELLSFQWILAKSLICLPSSAESARIRKMYHIYSEVVLQTLLFHILISN